MTFLFKNMYAWACNTLPHRANRMWRKGVLWCRAAEKACPEALLSDSHVGHFFCANVLLSFHRILARWAKNRQMWHCLTCVGGGVTSWIFPFHAYRIYLLGANIWDLCVILSVSPCLEWGVYSPDWLITWMGGSHHCYHANSTWGAFSFWCFLVPMGPPQDMDN